MSAFSCISRRSTEDVEKDLFIHVKDKNNTFEDKNKGFFLHPITKDHFRYEWDNISTLSHISLAESQGTQKNYFQV